MAVKIRLRKMGAKKKPFYRLVVADVKSPRGGRFIESIGIYDPRAHPPVVKVDEEKAIHWLKVGAQPTETAGKLLSKAGVMQRFAELRARKGLPSEAPIAR